LHRFLRRVQRAPLGYVRRPYEPHHRRTAPPYEPHHRTTPQADGANAGHAPHGAANRVAPGDPRVREEGPSCPNVPITPATTTARPVRRPSWPERHCSPRWDCWPRRAAPPRRTTECGTASPSARAAATGTSTPATATTADCSSP